MSIEVRVKKSGSKTRVSIEFELGEGSSMMQFEEQILQGLNDVGRQVTEHCLESFDTDGSAIEIGATKLSSKGRVFKKYQTPYGEVGLERHVYQSSRGGATYCPLDHSARIVLCSTPRFARMCSRKYATMKSTLAQSDLAESHGREVSRCYLQDIAQAVGQVAQIKQESWRYGEPPLSDEVHTIGVGIDGTCVLFCEQGYRQPMVGTISLYNMLGERLSSVYVGEAPEHGKEKFLRRMEQEIALYKQRYPKALWIAIADGARDYWTWLSRFSDYQILDYFHAVSYLEKAATGLFRSTKQRVQWFESSRHRLKEADGAAQSLLEEMQSASDELKLSPHRRKSLKSALGYFSNYVSKMNYAGFRKLCFPIGSGVTEAACKTLVKERMSGSGMKWKQSGAATVLNLRSLILSGTRWKQFWDKITRVGY